MEYRWIAQDSDGIVAKFEVKPNALDKSWSWQTGTKWKCLNDIQETVNPNWESSLINLETHGYKIHDGVLIKVEKVKTKRHKHADLMIKFANNPLLSIEFYDDDYKKWVCAGDNPTFYPDVKYRIKPAKKTIRFRNYITDIGNVEATTDKEIEDEPWFSKWIGDWQEVEV